MSDAADTLSDLERSVLLAMAEDDPERETLLLQIGTVRVVDRDYTGVGLYTKFEEYPKLGLVHPEL
ncbi:MAG: hypothetical protein EOP84_09775 [Verrucomicrobiaceae bacterium]|nr:MAG: hypothetical protein EOP84_09775 [Verrucomicrobiaceae bacterium]